MRLFLFYILLLFFAQTGFTQSSSNTENIIEIEQQIEKASSDTTLVRLYCNLSRLYRRSNVEKAEETAENAFHIAQTSNDSYSISRALLSIGMTKIYKSYYDLGIKYAEKSLFVLNPDTINLKNNDFKTNEQLGMIYNAFGTAYDFKSDYATAIKFYLKGKSIFETIHKQEGIAVASNNLGICYLYVNDLEQSESYFQTAFDYYIEVKDTNTAYQAKMNLGIIDYYKGNLNNAVNSFIECEKVMEQIGNIRSQGHCLTNIGDVYKELGQFDSSLYFMEKGIEVDLILNDIEGLSADYSIIGRLYEEMGQLNKAKKYFTDALNIAKDTKRKVTIRDSYLGLYSVEKKLGNYKNALENHIKYTIYYDSIQKESNSKALGKVEAESEFNKQIAIQQIENDKKLQIEEEKRKQQSIILYFSIGVILVILFFVYMVYKSLLQTRVQKELVHEAKLEIEEKNKELVDSIKYAKRIQLALLKETNEEKNKLPNHFVLFEPKDIVSGDFYWTYQIDRYWYVAVVDCTGHGVPGALLTMLGTAYLNEICAGNRLLTPGQILDKLKEKITTELGQTGERGGSKDGMDISLIRLNLDTNEVQWAGANNPLYFINNKGLQEIKPDKQPIGFSENATPFTNHYAPMQTGESLYLFSDGYADQFGGPKGKKFKYSNFKKLLLETDLDSAEIQKGKLLQTIRDWQGNLEQLDDICIIGIRI